LQTVKTTSGQMSQVSENGRSRGKRRMGRMRCQTLQSRAALSCLFHWV